MKHLHPAPLVDTLKRTNNDIFRILLQLSERQLLVPALPAEYPTRSYDAMPSDVDIPLVDHKRLVWKTEEESLLGQGSFGIVYRGTWNGTPVAIKIVKPARNDQTSNGKDKEPETAAIRQHRREIHRLAAIHNPYIIQYLGVFRDQHSRDLYIVTEYLEGGSLHDSLCKMRARDAVLDDRSFLQIARQMAYGLNHVHSQRYTHGDMKPQNILLTASISIEAGDGGFVSATLATTSKVKIADFGLSKRLEGAEPVGFQDSAVMTTDFGTGPCGTYLYMSPEAYNGVSQLTDADAKAADIYAYGLILFELLSGLQSWGLERVRNPMQLHLLVRAGGRPSWGDRLNDISPTYVALIERCWSHISEDRPTADDIVNELQDLQLQYADKLENGQERVSPTPVVVSNTTTPGTSVPKSAADSSGGYSHSPSEDLATPQQDDDVTDAQDSLPNSEDVVHEHHSSFGGRDPIIVAVDSMRRITKSQEAELWDNTTTVEDIPSVRGAGSSDALDAGDQDGIARSHGWEQGTTGNEGWEGKARHTRREVGAKLGMAEIDESVVGGVQVMRVQSVPIHVPDVEPLQVPQDSEKRATMGTGSVAANLALPAPEKARSGAELLESFVIAGAGVREDERNTQIRSDIAGNTEDDFACAKHPPARDGEKESCATAQGAFLQQPEIHSMYSKPSGGFVGQNRRAEDYRSLGKQFTNADTRPNGRPPTEATSPSQLQMHDNCSRPSAKLNDTGECSRPAAVKSGAAPVSSCGGRVTPSTSAMPSEGRMISATSHIHPFARRTDIMASPPNRSNPSCFGDSTLRTGLEVRPHGEKAQGPLAKYRPHGTMTGHGATAPLLSDTAYGTVVGSTGNPILLAPRSLPMSSWPSPGSEHCFTDTRIVDTLGPNNTISPGSLTDIDAVFRALETPDAAIHLRSLWKRGGMRTVAAGLAQARTLTGNEILQLTCDFLALSNRWPSNRRDPMIDKDLCTAIGNITRNKCIGIGPETVLATLRVAVSTMFAYRTSFQQNAPLSVDVYVACNYAVCNLFKAHNVIQDPELRAQLANWILYSISWNVYEDGTSRGPHKEMLSYAATSAARNFMWLNEDNAVAFTRSKWGQESQGISTLIVSMKYFKWTGGLPVLETCLSALAITVNLPQQREEFMSRHGVALVMDVLERHLSNAKLAKLGFSMVIVLMSMSVQNVDKVEKLEKWCIEDQVCGRLVAVVDGMHEDLRRDKERLGTLQMGYDSLLTCARCSHRLRANLVQKGANETVLRVTRWLSSVNQMGTTDQVEEAMAGNVVKVGVSICELIQELSKEPGSRNYFRKETKNYLEMMLRKDAGDTVFANTLWATLEMLSTEETVCSEE